MPKLLLFWSGTLTRLATGFWVAFCKSAVSSAVGFSCSGGCARLVGGAICASAKPAMAAKKVRSIRGASSLRDVKSDFESDKSQMIFLTHKILDYHQHRQTNQKEITDKISTSVTL